MLDDLKYIHQKDAQDALGVAQKQWEQYIYEFNFDWKSPRTVEKVVFAGMGGSGLAAKVAKSWPGIKLPHEIVQSYDLPDSTDSSTLLICSSYSGNTEEALSVFDQAMNMDDSKTPLIVVVASGGKLLEMAQKADLPCIQLPGGFQPRMTLGYQVRALLEILEAANVVSDTIDQLNSAAHWLKDNLADWLPEIPTSRNPAKKLAQELMGKSPVIYAGPKLYPAAYKWKISFNENAKNVAWCNQIPEFNHNEFLGWSSHPVQKPYAIIDLRSDLEHPRVQKRFIVTEKLLSGRRPATNVVEAKGDSLVQQILWTVAYGDFVSLYLALLNGLNPTPVDLIEKFKTELNEQ